MSCMRLSKKIERDSRYKTTAKMREAKGRWKDAGGNEEKGERGPLSR